MHGQHHSLSAQENTILVKVSNILRRKMFRPSRKLIDHTNFSFKPNIIWATGADICYSIFRNAGSGDRNIFLCKVNICVKKIKIALMFATRTDYSWERFGERNNSTHGPWTPNFHVECSTINYRRQAIVIPRFRIQGLIVMSFLLQVTKKLKLTEKIR